MQTSHASEINDSQQSHHQQMSYGGQLSNGGDQSHNNLGQQNIMHMAEEDQNNLMMDEMGEMVGQDNGMHDHMIDMDDEELQHHFNQAAY